GPSGASGSAGATGPTGPTGTTSWSGITDKPATFTPSTHIHTISDVTNLQAALDGKEELGAVTIHAAESDPHATANYAIMVGGGRRIFVQATDPGSAASDGDLWIDTA
nr:hypothetical protein [Candidatus Nanoperiomorbaceae bacterium]